MDTQNQSINITRTNSSTASEEADDYFTFTLVYDLTLASIALAITCTNMIVMVIYCRCKQLRMKSANLLLFNQALVDLLHGTATSGITIFGSSEFVARQIIYQFSLALSLHTVVLVSVERYVFILKPLYHKRTVTIFRIRVAIILSWLSSLLWIPFRMAHLTDADIDMRSYIMYYIAISDAIFFALIVLMTYLHVSTYRAVRTFIRARHSKLIHSSQHRSSPTVNRRLKLRHHMKELRVTKIFFSMFIAFIVSYVPLFVTGLIHISGASESFTGYEFNLMSLDVVFYMFNCLFNPVVTISCKEDYRRVFKQWMRTMFTSFNYDGNKSNGSKKKKQSETDTELLWRE